MARPRRLLFGEDAELYDRARPTYPDELFDDLVGFAGGPGRAVDAACGTGKVTVGLAARGFGGVGVEADPSMAAVARRNLAPFGGWRVDGAQFEEWQPRTGDVPFDLITVGAAWHWFDAARAGEQAHRLLLPGGWLAIFGHDHRFDEDDPELRREIDAAYAELAPDRDPPAEAADRLPQSGFGAPVVREYPVTLEYTAAEWVDRVLTSSDLRMRAPEVQRELLDRIARAVDAHGGIYVHHAVCRLDAVQHT